MSKKISIIVPIYNVEKYLEKCIKSIVSQTYKDLEVILVDDGSNDNSGKIADAWAIKDDRIKVIHKKNGGLSEARNSGMKIATGEYIGFVDSDDWINCKMYEILMENLNQYDADISVCSFKKVYENKVVEQSKVIDKKIYKFNAEEALEDLINEGKLKQIVCNKLYKKKLIDNVYFEYGKIHEDEFWTYQVLSKTNNIVYTERQLYYYLQREGSIMNKSFSIKRLYALEARNNRLKYIKEKFPKLQLQAKKSLFFSCLYQYQSMLSSDNVENKEMYSQAIEKYIYCIEFHKNERKKLILKEKLWIKLAYISLDFTCRLRNLMKIGI